MIAVITLAIGLIVGCVFAEPIGWMLVIAYMWIGAIVCYVPHKIYEYLRGRS